MWRVGAGAATAASRPLVSAHVDLLAQLLGQVALVHPVVDLSELLSEGGGIARIRCDLQAAGGMKRV